MVLVMSEASSVTGALEILAALLIAVSFINRNLQARLVPIRAAKRLVMKARF